MTYLDCAVKLSEISAKVYEEIDELERIMDEAKGNYTLLNDLNDDKTLLMNIVEESYKASKMFLELNRNPSILLLIKTMYHVELVRLSVIRHKLVFGFFIKKHLVQK